MTDYELWVVTKQRLERVWKQAERRSRHILDQLDYSGDEERDLSRGTGGRV
ncbi:MAG TPA: hypothetical protein VF134_02360 [Candidatus Dormibacteraeota bacterium]